MKRSFVVLIAVSLPLSVAGFGQTAPRPSQRAVLKLTLEGDKALTPLEQTLMAAEKSYVEAAKKGDVAFFKSTLADDFSFVAFDGQLYGRQEMLDEFSSGGIDLLPYNMKVVPVSDGVAIVTYDVVLRVPPSEDQGPPPRYQHFSTVWAKQGDMWKMKFQQMSVSHWGDW